MAGTSCTQLLALLVFASVAVLLVKAEVCEDLVGSCIGIDCKAVCAGLHPGGEGTCDQSQSCTCKFECSHKTKCYDGLGRCTDDCNKECCAQNCARKHSGGVGFCDANSLCQCEYLC